MLVQSGIDRVLIVNVMGRSQATNQTVPLPGARQISLSKPLTTPTQRCVENVREENFWNSWKVKTIFETGRHTKHVAYHSSTADSTSTRSVLRETNFS